MRNFLVASLLRIDTRIDAVTLESDPHSVRGYQYCFTRHEALEQRRKLEENPNCIECSVWERLNTERLSEEEHNTLKCAVCKCELGVIPIKITNGTVDLCIECYKQLGKRFVIGILENAGVF